MSPRWADIVDEEEREEQEQNVFVTVRLPGGRSTYVMMENNSTISELNQWIENTQEIPRNSFGLSDEEGYLKRQRLMETLAPSCSLLLTKRVVDGAPRGLVLRRCGAPMFGKRRSQ